jgi:RNA polymerase sigma-70 factor, ECF subfamily
VSSISRVPPNDWDEALPAQPLSIDEIRRLYGRHSPALLLYARTYAADAGAAEDVVHRVFLKLLSGNYVITGNATAYLYRSVKNEAMNDRRSRSREVPFVPEAHWFSSDGRADGEQEAQALEQAIAELPDEQRDAVVMRVWSEMTFEEVAEATGVSVNTAASRYRYGLAKLRERLGAGEKYSRKASDEK